MRVALITTGHMELGGLPDALQRIFPDHEFHAEPFAPKKPFHGFTSNKVLPLSPGDPDGHAVTMLRAALGALMRDGDSSSPSDIAILFEDLELCNRGNEEIVTEHVRASARRVLQGIRSANSRERATRLLREKTSFHLAVPMPESWFFGDPAALKTEVPETSWPPLIEDDRDPEDFRASDPRYLADDGTACAGLLLKGKKPDWVTPRREEHPKHYLEWLLRDPRMADCTTYKEQWEGVRLLKKMDLRAPLSNGAWFPYLRALVRDLEAALGPSPMGIPEGGMEAPRTSLSVLPPDPILRNL